MTAATAVLKRRKSVADEITGLVRRINEAIRDDKNIRMALSTTLAEHKTRIFEKGLDAKDSKIGTYSTTPASISKKNQAKNTGKTYFKFGYSEYKSAIGRNPGFVILRNTDQMMSDYAIQGSSGDYGFGFQNQANADKSGYVEEHFDKQVFALSEKEQKTLADTIFTLATSKI